MNLNFYQPGNNDYIENLRNTLNENLNKLDQLRNLNLTAQTPQHNQVNQPLQPQRYYLDCGVKEDWEEFLKINYNITERQIFDDYRLFLQAKSELHETADKEKLEAMKQKISPVKQKENRNVGNNTDATNQLSNRNSKQAMANNNNSVQNKGDKYVR